MRKVEAIKQGYLDNRLYEPGDKFFIPDPEEVEREILDPVFKSPKTVMVKIDLFSSKWMKLCPEESKKSKQLSEPV